MSCIFSAPICLCHDFLCGVMYIKYIVNYSWSVFLYHDIQIRAKLIYFERGFDAPRQFVEGGICLHPAAATASAVSSSVASPARPCPAHSFRLSVCPFNLSDRSLLVACRRAVVELSSWINIPSWPFWQSIDCGRDRRASDISSRPVAPGNRSSASATRERYDGCYDCQSCGSDSRLIYIQHSAARCCRDRDRLSLKSNRPTHAQPTPTRLNCRVESRRQSERTRRQSLPSLPFPCSWAIEISDDIMTSSLKKLSISIKIHVVKPLSSLFGEFPNCRPNPSAVVVS